MLQKRCVNTARCLGDHLWEMEHLICLMCLITSAYVLPSVADTEPEASLSQTNQVCYKNFGCFSNDSPYSERYPQSPDEIVTKFQLFIRESIQDPQILDARNPTDALTVWTNLKSRPTKFIIHGFRETIQSTYWIKKMAVELLKNGDYNVILVDWSGGNQLPITQGIANSRIVGAQIGVLVNHLIDVANITAGDFHIIGHSLGAHIAGYIGERVHRLGRISGLDPANIHFEDEDRRLRLDETDAEFVDTIHSDMATILRKKSAGTSNPSGQANFFPNGGHHHPGCRDSADPITMGNNVPVGVGDFLFCSHTRAWKYYTESINSPCQFPAFPCASENDFQKHQCHDCGDVGCNSMGFRAVKPPEGQIVSYYLTTGSQAPFCRFPHTISIKFADEPGIIIQGVVAVSMKGDVSMSEWVTVTGSTPVRITPGKTYWFDLYLTEDVGNVTNLAFWWEQSISQNFTGPARNVYVENIAIIGPETGVIKKLCPEDQEVTSDSILILSKPCD